MEWEHPQMENRSILDLLPQKLHSFTNINVCQEFKWGFIALGEQHMEKVDFHKFIFKQTIEVQCEIDVLNATAFTD